MGFALFISTHLLWLFDLPGVHYDEAWFADLAWRISSEPGFWPLHGMNSYTIPFSAYLVAPFFAVLGPSYETARLVLAATDFLAWIAIIQWVGLVFNRRAALGSLIIASLAPVAIFESRLFLEVTTLHTACLASVLWGIVMWRKKPPLSTALLLAGALVGILSHVLFVGVVIAAFAWVWTSHPQAWKIPRARWIFSAIALGVSAMFLSAGVDLGGSDAIKAFVVSGFALLGVLAFGFRDLRSPSERWRQRYERILLILAIPGVFFFLFFEWAGFWPYAQITGAVRAPWVPLNFALGAGVLFTGITSTSLRDRSRDLRPLFIAFLWVTAVTTFSVFKPTSAKYWTLPTSLFVILSGILWSRVRYARVIAALFVAWNLSYAGWAYFQPYLQHGATRESFAFLWVKDSARYYRPVLRAYRWLESEGCHLNEIVLDGERTDFTFRLQQRFDEARKKTVHCKLGLEQKFYVGAEASAPAESTRVAHHESWGDLSVYTF